MLSQVRTHPIAERLYAKLRTTKIYNLYLERVVRKMTEQAGDVALARDATYMAYLRTQIAKSFGSNKSSLRKPSVNERTRYLVAQLNPFLESPRHEQRVLCVGCRNTNELDHIEQSCGVKAVGLDLFSEDPRIIVGDMHKMPFARAEFDALYSCHNLEHAYDYKVVLDEFVRVVKPGGLITIEVPISFQKNETDFWDFGNVDGLISAIGPHVAATLFREEAANAGNNDKRVARVVLRTKAG